MTSSLKETQVVKFNSAESDTVTEIIGDVVNVECGDGLHNHGSSKIKLIDKVDFNWEFAYYRGHLVAAHVGGKVFAYGMKSKDGGMLRVTSLETNQRTLIKNLKEDVKDLAFSYSREEILLGCVDSEGNILVYEINDLPNSITYSLILHVYHEEAVISKPDYRIIWCPYVGNLEEEADDADKMFVVLNGTRAEVYNVSVLIEKYGKAIPLDPNPSFDGYTEIPHAAQLVDASFSSDGTAIAIASKDGYVKFFQLYMCEEEKQTCLHEWKPHDGLPLSSIIFIDNVLQFSSECWKFTITGANNNTEIKLWSCESWSCYQVIHFVPNPKDPVPNLYLNICVDYTGQYLIVSDINNRVLYVMELEKNDKQRKVGVTNISQFLLPAPFLSFHILEAESRKLPMSYNQSLDDLYDIDDDDDDEDESSLLGGTVVKMLVIQPKKLQECNIVFQTAVKQQPQIVDKPPEINITNGTLKDEILVDLDDEPESSKSIPDLDALQSSVTLLLQQQPATKFMTPDDFTSPSQKSRPNSVRNSLSAEKILPPTKSVDDDLPAIEHDFQRPQKDNFASAGSSPSREVQEILNNSATNFCNDSAVDYGTEEYFGNLANLEEEQKHPQKKYSLKTDNLAFPNTIGWSQIPPITDGELVKDTSCSLSELSKSQLQAVVYRVGDLENTIRDQSILIKQLHQDMKLLTAARELDNTNQTKPEWTQDLYITLANQTKLIETLLTNTKEIKEEKPDYNAIANSLSESMSDKIHQITQQELKQVVLPAIKKSIESYRIQIDTQYSQKLSSIDSMIKESVCGAIACKALIESLSLAIVNSVVPTLEKGYHNMIFSTLLPSWEKVCMEMFQQINDTFAKGTKEYTSSVESHMERQRKIQDKGKDVVVQMQTVSETLKTSTDKLTTNLNTEMKTQVHAAVNQMQEKLSQHIKNVVSEQIKENMKNHTAAIEGSVRNAVRSRAVTPAPQVDTHMTLMTNIQQLLTRRKYDEAFQLALSAENLTYVIYVCERVDINTLFGDECMLQQNCLLSLVQQLSMELNKNTELKLSFIRAAFLALSPDFPHTKQFVPKVLKELLLQLNIFMRMNPSVKNANEARLLKMAVDSMLAN